MNNSRFTVLAAALCVGLAGFSSMVAIAADGPQMIVPEMIKDILKDLPVELIMAADGNEAWEQISSLKPQLVLLDLNIPGKNGKEILQALQSPTGLSQVKVIAMSGVDR